MAKRKWILKLNNFLYLHSNIKVPARVAELVDALDSKSGFRKEVLVRFQSRVLYIILKTLETQCLRGFLLFRTFLFFTLCFDRFCPPHGFYFFGNNFFLIRIFAIPKRLGRIE